MAWKRQLHGLLSLPVTSNGNRGATLYIVATLALHVLIYYAVLVLHFSSPVVQDIPRVHKASLKRPLADRVIVFVVDGLRARTLFSDGLSLSPHLRHVVLHRGVLGVSRVRAPTVSRAGHLSLVSGVYEYLHAMTRPRLDNPFDSVLNRSSSGWLLGESEITDLLAVNGHAHIQGLAYPDALNEFGMADPGQLDKWVFRRLHELLNASAVDRSLHRRLNRPGVVFLLHLLGVDTFSHTHSLRDGRLQRTIARALDGIRRTEALFERYFKGDARTAYVVTADHGMAESSSHGAGDSLDETLTPLVAWGAGIRGPEAPLSSPDAPSEWSLPVRAAGMAQVDVCPLVASLLGLHFPVHSVGKTPIDLLNASEATKAELMRANARQALEHFLALRRQLQASTASWLLREAPSLCLRTAQEMLRAGEASQAAGDPASARRLFERLHSAAVAGLGHFHRYDAVLGTWCAVAVLLMSSAVAIIAVATNANGATNGREEEPQMAPMSLPEITVFAAGLLIAVPLPLIVGARAAVQGLYLLVVLLTWAAFRQRSRLALCLPVGRRQWALLGVALVLIQLLFLSILLQRGLASAALLIHLPVELMLLGREGRRLASAKWFAVGSVLLAAFPLLPTLVETVNFPAVYLGSALTVVVVTVFLRHQPSGRVTAVLTGHIMVLLLACANHYRLHSAVELGQGPPQGATAVTKGLMLVSILLIGLTRRWGSQDAILIGVWLGASVFMTLLSLSYETVFLFVLGVVMGAWASMHNGQTMPNFIRPWASCPVNLVACNGAANSASVTIATGCASATTARKPIPTGLDVHLLYRSASFLVYAYVCYYGIGNIPSISSYDPRAVLCLQTAFNLNVMTLIVFMKDTLPLLIISVHYLVVLGREVGVVQIYRPLVLFIDLIAVQTLLLMRPSSDWLTFASQINQFTTALFVLPLLSLTVCVSCLLRKG